MTMVTLKRSEIPIGGQSFHLKPKPVNKSFEQSKRIPHEWNASERNQIDRNDRERRRETCVFTRPFIKTWRPVRNHSLPNRKGKQKPLPVHLEWTFRFFCRDKQWRTDLSRILFILHYTRVVHTFSKSSKAQIKTTLRAALPHKEGTFVYHCYAQFQRQEKKLNTNIEELRDDDDMT